MCGRIYDSMSLDPKKRAEGVTKGKFQLHVRMINPKDGAGYPRWIKLPRIKAGYDTIASDNTRRLWCMNRRFFLCSLVE